MNRQKQSGFTLYELMITVVLIGIVLMIGVPNLAEFRKNSEMASTANDLLSAFVVARSEAPRAKNNITVCSSKEPMEAVPDCDDEKDWRKGWIVFIDDDGDARFDGPPEVVLRRYPPMKEDYEIKVDKDGEFFSYGPNGLGRADVDPNKMLRGITICDDRGNIVGAGGWSTARRLVISPMGRATIIRDVDRIDSAGGCP